MKIRQGFVSNSSSSSYLVVAQEGAADSLPLSDEEKFMIKQCRTGTGKIGTEKVDIYTYYSGEEGDESMIQAFTEEFNLEVGEWWEAQEQIDSNWHQVFQYFRDLEDQGKAVCRHEDS